MSSKSKCAMNLIVACDCHYGIGTGDNNLPWKLPKEFKYFTEKTIQVRDKRLRNAVIMGRKCWESIPEKFRPLKNRLNVVISRTMAPQISDDLWVFDDFQKAVEKLANQYSNQIETIWNVGGSDIYRMGLESEYLDKVYMTHIKRDFGCKVHFPKINFDEFETVPSLENIPSGVQTENGIEYEFKVYRKIYWG